MANTVTVTVNDNITKIIQQQRGVPPVEVHQWVNRILNLNPHISNPDRIYPNEKLLIPDALHEPVSNIAVWKNALRHMPPQPAFHPPMHYEMPVQVIMPGDTIDRLSGHAFADSRYSHVPESLKRAVFLHNNPRLLRCLGGIPLPGGTLANMTPFMLPHHEVHQWETQHPIFKVEFDQLRPEVKSIYTTIGPTPTYLLGKTVLKAKSQGAVVGLNDIVSGMASGYVGASTMAIGQTTTSMQDLTNQAVKKFGRGVVCSNKAVNLRKVEQFLRNHPKYSQLMQHLKELPKHVIPETDIGNAIATTKSPYARARLMRQQVFMPTLKPSGTKYMGTIKSALNSSGRIVRIASKGMVAVPIVLGVCDVIQASPEMKMRTMFEQGFGILGGYAISVLGSHLVGLYIVTALGLGPLGLFITAFLCATAGAIAGTQFGMNFGNKLYELQGTLRNGRLFYSPSDVLGAI